MICDLFQFVSYIWPVTCYTDSHLHWKEKIVSYMLPSDPKMFHLLAQLRIHTVRLKLNPAVTVYVQRSHDHRNVSEADWCFVAASSGKKVA